MCAEPLVRVVDDRSLHTGAGQVRSRSGPQTSSIIDWRVAYRNGKAESSVGLLSSGPQVRALPGASVCVCRPRWREEVAFVGVELRAQDVGAIPGRHLATIATSERDGHFPLFGNDDLAAVAEVRDLMPLDRAVESRRLEFVRLVVGVPYDERDGIVRESMPLPFRVQPETRSAAPRNRLFRNFWRPNRTSSRTRRRPQPPSPSAVTVSSDLFAAAIRCRARTARFIGLSRSSTGESFQQSYRVNDCRWPAGRERCEPSRRSCCGGGDTGCAGPCGTKGRP
jgi:hypothetical protein